jgi:iduronate 2-sulfatase
VAGPLNAQTPPGYGPSGLDELGHADGKNAQQVAAWLENDERGEKPFFIACGIHKPHVPFLAPQKYFDQYPLESLDYTLDPADLWNGLPKSASSPRFGSFGFELGVENESLRREYMQAYHACISFIDAQIGVILDAVKAQGLWEDTIVVFTSDHGYQLGEHFMWGKVTLFEVCDRVPLIVRVPGMAEAGSESEALVELVDLYPTLAELGGVETPDDLQGKSLVPLLENPGASGKEVVYTVVSRGENLGRAIRTAEWRYAEWPDGEELYSLSEDPNEWVNLANNPEYRPRVQEMRRLLKERQRVAGSAAN